MTTGILVGFVLLGAVDAAAIVLTVPLPAPGLSLRLGHLFYDAAETVGLGALAGAAAFACFWGLPRGAAAAAYVVAATAIVYRSLGEDLRVRAGLWVPVPFEGAAFAALVLTIGLAVPIAHLLAAWASRRAGLGLAGAALALSGLIVNHRFFPDDYFAVHAVVAWGAATFAGASLAPRAQRLGASLLRVRSGRPVLGLAAALALFGILHPPPNAVRCELFRQPCAVAPWVLAAAVWPRPEAHTPPSGSPWLRDRSAEPPVPPTSPRLLPDDAVVVLVTVDALRADALFDPRNDGLFPALTAIKRRGAVFTHASAAGSQTAYSLSTLFSGRYVSELSWRLSGEAPNRYRFPSADPSPRFPAILSARGVATTEIAGLVFLGSSYGVARGFTEEKVVVTAKEHAQAREVVDPLLVRLQGAERRPLFLFAHLLEPHDPYDRGRQEGTPHQRYLSEIAVADAQIDRVVQALERLMGDRWVLIVGADHGEAFGEHQTTTHGKTLYEELLHVPLLVLGPRIAARTVAQRVGLVDLGPTILDLFGIEAPASYEGQSLVPLLAGRDMALTRPLIAECRLRRSLTSPAGLKVIDDPRRKTVEIYDLESDPGEARNLFGASPPGADPALAELRAFFAAHAGRDEEALPYRY